MATLSTKMNGGSRSSGKTIDKKKARPGLHVCAHCKREVYHKDGNCLELEVNKTKRYPGWKSVSTKEYDELGCTGSGLGIQSWLHKLKLKLKTEVQLQKYYTPLTIQVEKLEPEEHLYNLQVTTTEPPESRKGSRQLRFTLTQHHRDKDSTKWRQYLHICASLAHSKNANSPPQDRLT